MRPCWAWATLVGSLGCASVFDEGVVPPPLPPDVGDPTPSTDDDSAPGDDDTPDDDTSPTPDDDDSTDDVDPTPSPPSEVRALWVTRWNWSDPADIDGILDDALEAGFNTVFFQVRGNADSYYPSAIEPWARSLTGTLGGDPGWDPLDHAIVGAHARGLELHPWLNTFPAWSGTTPPTESSPRHILLSHPEWRVAGTDGVPAPYQEGYLFVSPGIEAVRAHVATVAADIAARYAIDGLHLDYIRYPGASYSHDALSEAAFASYQAGGGGLDWNGWQREMVIDTAARVRDAVRDARPGTPVTAAVWGIYDDLWAWNSSEGRDDYHQDSVAMVQRGVVDAIVPMIYWPMTDPPGGYTDFATLVDFFEAEVGGPSLWVGLDGDYEDFSEIEAQIEHARSVGAAGVSIFAWPFLDARDYWDELAGGPFAPGR